MPYSRRWNTPPFESLPAVEGTDCRWVGSRIMAKDQYVMEEWRRAEVSAMDADDEGELRNVTVYYWTGSLAGYQRYAQRRSAAKRQKREQYRTREAEEQGYTDWVNAQAAALEDSKPSYGNREQRR